jgi:hypothetical protein
MGKIAWPSDPAAAAAVATAPASTADASDGSPNDCVAVGTVQ